MEYIGKPENFALWFENGFLRDGVSFFYDRIKVNKNISLV